MGFFSSHRIKNAVASLALIASFLSPAVAKAEWSSNTKKSFVLFKQSVSELKGNPSPKNMEEAKAMSEAFVQNMLVEVSVSLKKDDLAAAIGDLEVARRGMESLKKIGVNIARYEALAKKLEKQIQDKGAEGQAKVKTLSELQRERASPACDKEPDWVKNWRKGVSVWHDGNKIYVVGYAKERGEDTAREMAVIRARTVFAQSMGKVEKFVTQDVRGGTITFLITGNVSNLSEREFHHHEGKGFWETWVWMDGDIGPSYGK